jgi:hypothetical protein
MELADRTEQELNDLYVLKYGPAASPLSFFAIPSTEELQCPIKRELVFRQMMRQQGPIAMKLQNAEMELNKLQTAIYNLTAQLNNKQTAYAQPYNPAISMPYGISPPTVPLPPTFISSISL